jgi:hypothetical protein
MKGSILIVLLGLFYSSLAMAICDQHPQYTSEWANCMQTQCAYPQFQGDPACATFGPQDPITFASSYPSCTSDSQCTNNKGCYTSHFEDVLSSAHQSTLENLQNQSQNQGLLSVPNGEICVNDWNCESYKCKTIGTEKRCSEQKFCRLAQVGEVAQAQVLCAPGLMKDPNRVCVAPPSEVANYTQLFDQIENNQCALSSDPSLQDAITGLHLTETANNFFYRTSIKENDPFRFAETIDRDVIRHLVRDKNAKIKEFNQDIQYLMNNFNLLASAKKDSEELVTYLGKSLTQHELFVKRMNGNEEYKNLLLKLEDKRKYYDYRLKDLYNRAANKTRNLLKDFVSIEQGRCKWKFGSTNEHPFCILGIGSNSNVAINKYRTKYQRQEFDLGKPLIEYLNSADFQNYKVVEYLNELGMPTYFQGLFNDDKPWMHDPIVPPGTNKSSLKKIFESWRDHIKSEIKKDKVYQVESDIPDYIVDPDLNLLNGCINSNVGAPEKGCEGYDERINKIIGRTFAKFILFSGHNHRTLKHYFKGNSSEVFSPNVAYSTTYLQTAEYRNDLGDNHPEGWEHLSAKGQALYQTYINYFYLSYYHEKMFKLRDQRMDCIRNYTQDLGPIIGGRFGDDDDNSGGGGNPNVYQVNTTGPFSSGGQNSLDGLTSANPTNYQTASVVVPLRSNTKKQKNYLKALAKRNGLPADTFMTAKNTNFGASLGSLASNNQPTLGTQKTIANKNQVKSEKSKNSRLNMVSKSRRGVAANAGSSDFSYLSNSANSRQNNYRKTGNHVDMDPEQQGYLLDNMDKISQGLGQGDTLFKKISRAYLVSGYPRLLKRASSARSRMPSSVDIKRQERKAMNRKNQNSLLKRLQSDFLKD